MNSCPHAEKIIDYQLQQLTEEEKAEFEAHLRSCEICQQELQVEMAIENDLTAELEPGFIENRIMTRLQLQQARDMRPFWLYSLRMVVYGVTATIVSMILLPVLLKLPLPSGLDLSRYSSGLAGLLGQLAPFNTFIVIFGFCYVAVFFASIYTLTQIRR
jgi:anti-sigma factor RsiW